MVQWLWYPFIPFGKVTLIQGNPGKGKTWLLAMALCRILYQQEKELPMLFPSSPSMCCVRPQRTIVGDTIKA
ncbi:MAG: hypothetical protein ACLVC1_10825 [Mediterraneibacter gnavus]